MHYLSKLKKVVVLAVVISAILFVACYGGTAQTGILQGKVKIGPIWPVERSGDKRVVPPQVYEARKVMVYNRNRTKLVKEVGLGQDGYYRVELNTGVYVVDINYVGIDRSSDVPKEIEIGPGETAEVNIDIDTGIR